MRLTFVVLFACWTIYSSSRAVLSLPPSLIANAASLQQRQNTKSKRESPAALEHFDSLWHKDATGNTEDDTIASDVVRPRSITTNGNGNDNDNDNGNVVQFNNNSNSNKNNNNSGSNNESSMHHRTTRTSESASGATAGLLDPRLELQLKLVDDATATDAMYDLNGFLQATATAAAAAVANDKNKNQNQYNNNNDGGDYVGGGGGGGGGEAIQSMEAQPLLLPPQETTTRDANEFFTPLKYWARHCQSDKNCPQQYYRALFANRNSNKAAAALGHQNQLNIGNNAKNFEGKTVDEANLAFVNRELTDETPDIIGGRAMTLEYYDDATPLQKMNDDIFMFLNGEEDLMKFLRWAMRLLYPHERFANYTANDAEYYHPGMYIWKKLNLSGHLEPPLFVEEPHYVIVRREQLSDDFRMKSNYNNDDPFIPPRGRKQNMPDLDALLHRYETFVPNRGKRDKIKDMLKSDDLFFPNRGKKLKPPTPTTMKRDFEYESKSNSNNKNGNRLTKNTAAVVDIASYDDGGDWKTALPVVLAMRDLLEKLFQRKLQKLKNHADGNKITTTTTNAHEINYAGDDHPDWLGTMLNYKFNGNDPSVKQSMPTAVAINGETREMSTPQKVAASATATATEIEAASTIPTDATDLANADIGVDSGGTKIGANRLLSTRSMSTAMAQRRQQHQQLHQRQQQQQRHRLLQHQQQQQHQRRLSALSQQFDADNNMEHANWHQFQKDSPSQHPNAHQVKSFNNFDPLLWRQIQLMQQQPTDTIQHSPPQQYQQKRQTQQGFWPQENFDWLHSNAIPSNAIDGSYRDFTASGSPANNDYNYLDT